MMRFRRRIPSMSSTFDTMMDSVMGELFPRNNRPKRPRMGGSRQRPRTKRQDFALELMEPRLLLSADLNFNLAGHSDVTVLSRDDANSVQYLDIIDNATGATAVHHQVSDANGLTIDSLVITGTAASERVRLDLGSGIASAVKVGITLQMGTGDDVVQATALESTGPATPVSVDGEGGLDTIAGIAPGKLTLSNASLKLGDTGPTVSLSNIDAAFLTGASFDTGAFNAGPIATANIAQWAEQGPGPIHNGQLTGIPDRPVSGAIQALLPHPTDPNIIYIGAAAGGVWKTVDGGVSWTPLTDQFPSQSFTSLAFDSADATHQTIYAGTGKMSSFGNFGKAIGVLKTTDAGAHWTLLNHPLFSDNPVFGIVANGNTVLAATAKGMVRSADGGDTWQLLSYTYVDAATVNTSGSNYKLYDVVAFQYGADAADVVQFKVNAIGAGGAVTDVTLLDAGSIKPGQTVPGAAVAMVSLTGSGSGLKLDMVTKNSGLTNGLMSEVVADFAQGVIYVANANSGAGNNGIYRSLDGGATFTKLPGADGADFTNATRIRLSLGALTGPNTPTLFAGVVEIPRSTLAAGAAQGATQVTLQSTVGVEVADKLVLLSNTPGVKTESIEVTAVNRSTNVVTLKSGLAAARNLGDPVKQEDGQDRVTQIVRIADSKNPDGSTGMVWKKMDAPGDIYGGISPGGQADKHFSLLADSTSPDIVYVGGDVPPTGPNGGPVGASNPQNWTGRLFRGNASNAPGSQWVSITDDNAQGTAPHGDSRQMVFRGGASGDIIETDDGGIKRLADPSNSGGNRKWYSLDGNLRLTEFVSVSYDPNNNIIAGGAQDNGVSRQDAAGSGVWTQVIPADGSITYWAVGPSSSTLYSSAQNFSSFTAFENFSTSGSRPDLEVNHTGFFDDDELYIFDSTIQFTTPWTINQIDPKLLMIGTTFLYEEDPDFLIGGDPGDDVTLQNGAPVKVDGKYTPDPKASVGVVTSIVYGGHSRPPGGTLQDVPRIAYVSANTTRPDASGTPRTVGVIYVRLGEDQKFLEITSWGGTVARDIVADPEDWRKLYVLDSNGEVFVGTQSVANSATYTWQKLSGNEAMSGNLDSLARIGAVKGEFQTIEAYLDEGADEFTDNDDKRVLLVGGFGGVFRTINPVDNNAVWSEFGANLPGNLVTDLHYNAKDDLLLAGTLGRGAWTVEHASRWLATPAQFTVTGKTGSVSETFQLGVNATNPWMLDAFVYANPGSPAGLPQASLPLAGIDKIKVDAGAGDDETMLDGSHGIIAVTGGIDVDGGTGTNSLVAAWLGAASATTPTSSTYSVTAPDGFGTQRSVKVVFSNVAAPPASASIDPLDAARGGLAQLSEATRDLLDNSLFGSDIPFLNAGSLSGGLSGRTIDTSTPPPLNSIGVDVRAGVGGGPVQIDDGGSLLSRLLDTEAFGLGEAGQITSLAHLRAELDALDDIANNVTLDTSNPADPRLHVQIVRDLIGVVDLDLDGAAILGALNLADGKIEIEGVAELGFRAALDLTIGIDANGFYVAPNAADDELKITHITIAPTAVKAGGRFGWLGVELTDPTITFDEDVGVEFKLHEQGPSDGKIRLEELVAAPAGMMTMQLIEDATQTDLVVHGLLSVSALVPGFDISLPVADANVTFTWTDLSDDVVVTFDNPAAQGAVDFARFLALDPATLVTRLGELKSMVGDLVADIDVDIPFVSVSLDGLVNVLDFVDANLLSRIGFKVGGAGPTLPDFGTVQEFTTGLWSSLLEQADPANYLPAELNGLFDLANLPLTYDGSSGELTYALDFRKSFSLTDTLDLNFDLGGGLAEFSTSSQVSLTGTIEVDFKLGVDLQDAIDAPLSPLDWIFLRDASLRFSLDATAADIDALGRFGFAEIEVVNGDATANFAVNIKLNDPNKNGKNDNRIDLAELKDAVLN